VVRKIRVTKKPFGGEHEEVPEMSSPFVTWVEQYRLILIVGVTVIVLASLGFLLLRYLNANKEEKAAMLFSQAYETYGKANQEGKPLDESLKLFEPIKQKYPHTGAGLLSLFYMGNCQFAVKKFDDAIASYNQFAREMAPGSQMTLMAFDSLGYCYEEKKDYRKALEFFEKTVTPPPGLGESGYFNIARCYETLGDKENTVKIYKKILTEYPNSARIGQVQEKIKVLESKG
jgi:tetratricopeptide (TPR) repeat protein